MDREIHNFQDSSLHSRYTSAFGELIDWSFLLDWVRITDFFRWRSSYVMHNRVRQFPMTGSLELKVHMESDGEMHLPRRGSISGVKDSGCFFFLFKSQISLRTCWNGSLWLQTGELWFCPVLGKGTYHTPTHLHQRCCLKSPALWEPLRSTRPNTGSSKPLLLVRTTYHWPAIINFLPLEKEQLSHFRTPQFLTARKNRHC